MSVDRGRYAAGAGDSNRFYMPIIDLMATLVVIMILIIAAQAIVQRGDYAETERVQKLREEARLLEERIRTLRLSYVYPADEAQAEALAYVSALAGRLADGAQAAAPDPDGMAVRLPADRWFDSRDPVRLTGEGQRGAEELADALDAARACVGGGSRPPACAAWPTREPERILVLVRSASAADLNGIPRREAARLQAQSLEAALATRRPETLRRSPSGRRLVEFGGLEGVEAGTGPPCGKSCVEIHVRFTPRQPSAGAAPAGR